MKKNFQNWNDYYYNVEYVPMNTSIIEQSVIAFWDNLSNNNKIKVQPEGNIAIQLKIQLKDLPQFRSITKVQVVPKFPDSEMKQNIIDLFVSSWLECDDYYHSLSLKNIVFTYKILPIYS